MKNNNLKAQVDSGQDWVDLVAEAEAKRARQAYLNGKPVKITGIRKGSSGRHVCKVCFDRKRGTIDLLGPDNHRLYEIDLEEAKTPDRLLSWLFHLGPRSPQVLGAILKVLDAVIWEATGESAEHVYCYRQANEGKPKGFDWTNWLKKESRCGATRNGMDKEA